MIYRKVDTLSESGDISGIELQIGTDINMRIIENKVDPSSGIGVLGALASSSHIGFCNSGYDIREGDTIAIAGEAGRYAVKYVDKEPGGAINHHYEVYLKLGVNSKTQVEGAEPVEEKPLDLNTVYVEEQ